MNEKTEDALALIALSSIDMENLDQKIDQFGVVIRSWREQEIKRRREDTPEKRRLLAECLPSVNVEDTMKMLEEEHRVNSSINIDSDDEIARHVFSKPAYIEYCRKHAMQELVIRLSENILGSIE